MKKNIAEFIGTFWLVLGGCGTAIFAAKFGTVGVGLTGVSLAFGLTVLTIAYSFGHISGAHLNPAVTIGLWAGGRIKAKEILPYVISQIAGALFAAAVLYVIVTGNGSVIGDFAANGYGEHSPGKYSMLAAILTEFVMTFMFLLIILGATDERANTGFAGIAIGLALTLIHLISIPVTNTSVNPARSISQAVFVGDWAISQLWLFVVVPVVASF
ncbi:aquaporin Z [Flavobacterium oreochromis]|nr:aquaporin Z [Flavobacterium oreochromis]QYS86996.1 aquaporin Z [Flavobacterium oreochromis]